MTTEISVIIPLYNKSYSIVSCVESVLNQLVKPYEIIIVDDGSTDESLYKVNNKFAKQIDAGIIKIIQQKNQGVSVARNVGANISFSNFLCFLDADDLWKPDFLLQMSRLIEDYPCAIVYSLQHETIIGSNTPVRNNCYYEDGFRGYVSNYFKASIKSSITNTSKSCIRKSSLESIGYFPEGEKVGEDLHVFIELARRGPFAFYNKVCVTRLEIEDFSRASRKSEVPYPFKYYAKNPDIKLSFWCKAYLHRVFLAHLKSSIKQKDLKGAISRTKSAIEVLIKN